MSKYGHGSEQTWIMGRALPSGTQVSAQITDQVRKKYKHLSAYWFWTVQLYDPPKNSIPYTVLISLSFSSKLAFANLSVRVSPDDPSTEISSVFFSVSRTSLEELSLWWCMIEAFSITSLALSSLYNLTLSDSSWALASRWFPASADMRLSAVMLNAALRHSCLALSALLTNGNRSVGPPLGLVGSGTKWGVVSASH